jgi:filamentous hemagglutinin family protein
MNRVDKNVVRRRRHSAWLSSCAMASALALAPNSAREQAFLGTPTVVTGTAGVSTGVGSTTINVGSSETVINWAPNDITGTGTIDFQPAGTTATFQARGNFTVLNRILPVDTKGNPSARMVSLNGTVNSTLIGGSGITAGNVWFYTPTGLIIGPTATMNVGGLILTTDDIQFTPNDPISGTNGTIYGPGGVIQFRGAANSTGLVDVQAGAQLNAVGNSSYIAMVSPRIQQGGTVSADRSIAYVAAEQADVTINAGMFDISIVAGTTDPNGIVHTGTTTGSASTSGFDAKTISFVALPKATALTMLLSGSIGYAPAADAFNDGSAVVLSSGYTTDQPTTEAAGSLGNISIDNASFANPIAAFASGTLGITAVGGPVAFGGNANLYAQDAIDVTLDAGGQLTSQDSLLLSSSRGGTGGTIDVSLGSKAAVTATGSIDLYTSSSFSPFVPATPLVGRGGVVTVDVNGGVLSAASIYGAADAFVQYDPATPPAAIGGTVSFTARNGGTISAGDFGANVDAYSGYSDTAGGAATAGTINLISQNGALNFGTVELDAEAFASAGVGSVGVISGGAATGGAATISLSGGTYNWDSLTAYTTSFAGYPTGGQGNSASGSPEAVSLSLSNNASLTVANDIYLDASALATVDGLPGTGAKGGTIGLNVDTGSSLAFTNLSAYAEGGIDLPFTAGVTPTNTPDVTGGTIDFTAGGAVTGNSVALVADAAELGASSTSGTARGGTIDMQVTNGGNLSLDDGSGTASLLIDAGALGAIGTSPANAVGGSATLSLADGMVDVAGTVTVGASGQWHQTSLFYGSGPDPQTGFDAHGGLATVQLLPGTAGTAQLTATSLEVNASGDASTPEFDYSTIVDGGPAPGTYGGPMFANGGDGTGGTATLSVAAGTLDLSAGGARVLATGQGGISAGSTLATAFQSGNGFGGVANVGITGGTGTLGSLEVDAFGVGGGGAFAGGVGELPALAGFGLGGNARLTFGGGSFSPASLILDATGTGGEGGGSDADQAGTDGGDGLGGVAGLISPSGATGTLTSANVLILAGGAGGAGGFGTTKGNGGDGIGGAAVTNLADGAFALGPVILGADGDGGGGVLGGQGTGGSANFKLADSTGPTGARTIDSLSLYANGIGGTGGSAVGASDAGSTGLDVEAFDATSGLGITGDFVADAEGSNAPAGQGFVALIGGAPLLVGGNSTITTSRDAVISGTWKFHTIGDLTITARSLSASAPLAADGNVAIDALNGISLGSLSSGGTTGLSASNGAITTADLRSAGLVTATGQSLLIQSGAGLTFANATATAGDLKIVTTGGLTANGPVTASGDVALIGNGGLSAGTVTSGGTTTLNAANGAVAVTDLHSPGLVSASGQSVNIASPGALTFGETSATAGDLTLTALDLAATGPLSASGNVTLDAANGIALGALSSGGTTDLTATNGAISATDLRSAGAVKASGRSISVASGGGLTFASANATAGDLAISTALGLTASGALAASGNVALSGGHGIAAGTVTSGGTTSLTAANGAIGISDLTSPGAVAASGESIDITSGGGLTFANAQATAGNLSLTALDLTAGGPLSASGNVALDAANGITAGTLTSGGTTALTSDGAIAVSGLSSAGLVTAVGASLDLASPGALSFADARATGGDLAVVTQGDLALANGSATGDLDLQSDAGQITGTGMLTSGGNALLSGQLGVSAQTLSSAGTTTVESASGPVSVADLTSAGPVTATGASVDIGSSGVLTFAAADATNGDLTIATASDLSLPTATATGAMALTSGGTIASNSLTAGGNFSVSGATGLDLTSVQSGGTTSLESLGVPTGGISAGDVTVTDLTSAGDVSAIGGAVTIGSTGALSFAGAQATGGNLLIAALDLRATGLLSATGNVDLDAANGIALDALTSGGTTTLTSDGVISATDLRSAGLVSATGGSIDIASGAGLSFGTLQANAGDLRVATVDDLVLDSASATGALNLASSAGSITANGALSGGGNVSVIGFGGVTLPSLTSGGTTSLTAVGGDISLADLRSAGVVTARGQGVSIVSPDALAFDTVSADANLSLKALAITATGQISAFNGTVSLDGANGLALGSVISGGTTDLRADDGAIGITDLRSDGPVQAHGRSIDIASGDDLAFGSATATAGDLSINTVNDLTADIVSAPGGVRLVTGENLHTTGDVTGASVLLSSLDNILVDGPVTAAGDLTVDAESTFTLGGSAVGTSIGVTSRDIQLASGAQLGARGTTQDITLTNSVFTSAIGGAGGAVGYDLDSAEAAHLFADNSITLASSGDVTLGDLQLGFGDTGNIGTGGFLKLTTPGNVTVNGAIALTTSSDDDTFSIDPVRIDVAAGQGSIAMQSASGALQGTLDLTADTVAILSPATRDAIGGLTDLSQISQQLDVPADPGPAGGYLQAGTIRITANDAFLVQNGGTSDAYAERRGFSANALDITTGSAATQIAINGVILQGGDTVTGLDTASLVTINDEAAAAGGQFDALSTINGCVIGADCATPPPPPPPEEPPVTNPTDDDLSGPIDHPTANVFSDQLFSLGDNAPLITPPLVDEPITGVGNDDLWISGCSDNSDDKRCADKKEGTE